MGKVLMILFTLLFISSAHHVYADSELGQEVAKKGDTIISAKSKKMNVSVKITTEKINIEDSRDETPPDSICSKWGWVTYPNADSSYKCNRFKVIEYFFRGKESKLFSWPVV